MMRSATWFVIAVILTGCQSLPAGSDWNKVVKPEERAQHLMAAGELYRARKIAQHLVTEDPANSDAQHLMAEIINREISRHKDLLDPKAVEEYDKQERNAEVQTWLERSRAYLALKQYEQAFLAAEKVFLYDAFNKHASSLIDEIRAKAVKEGKQGFGIQDRVVQEEIRERIHRYKKQAEKGLEQERWGSTRLAVEKMLILEPNNPYALKIQERIRTLRKTTLT